MELLFKLKTSEDKLAAITHQYEEKLTAMAKQLTQIREDKTAEVLYLREELNKANSKLEKLMERVTTQNNIGTINNNSTNSINISNTQIRQLLSEYSTGPVLETITNVSELFDEDDELFLEDIAYDHRKKILHETIGQCIVEVYKTADPKQQALWNTDSSRLNYIVKHAITKKSAKWIVDKKGIRVTEHIITPVLDHLKEKMADYVPDTKDVKALRIKGNMIEIIKNINDGELAKKINKYISKYFYMTDNIKMAIAYKSSDPDPEEETVNVDD